MLVYLRKDWNAEKELSFFKIIIVGILWYLMYFYRIEGNFKDNEPYGKCIETIFRKYIENLKQ